MSLALASRLISLLCGVGPIMLAQGIGGVRVSADPSSYDGKAPARIHFRASIELRGARRFQYHWVRSDGARSPVRTVSLSSPTPRDFGVTEEWLVVTPGKDLPIWEKIVVTAGKCQITSDPAVVIVNCR